MPISSFDTREQIPACGKLAKIRSRRSLLQMMLLDLIFRSLPHAGFSSCVLDRAREFNQYLILIGLTSAFQHTMNRCASMGIDRVKVMKALLRKKASYKKV